MNKINWSKADRIKHLEDNTTPCMEIDAPNRVNIRLYWTTGGSTYGKQVQTVIRTEGESYGQKTTGCGYSKIGEALTDAFAFLKIAPKLYQNYSANLDAYRIGGNYYKIEA
jgi:hypothetical protein